MTAYPMPAGKGVAIAVTAAAVVLSIVAVAYPVSAMFLAQSENVEQAQHDLKAYRDKIATAPHLQAQAEAIARQESAMGALVNGESTALAAANMQNAVMDVVQRHGGQLRSAQALPSTMSNGLAKIEVQYEVTLPLGGLTAATYEIETRSPWLFIDQADVRPELYGGATSGAPVSVRVSWTIHGYRRVGTP